MINAISAADIALSSQVQRLPVTKPLGVFSSKTEWLNVSLLFLRMNYMCKFKSVVVFLNMCKYIIKQLLNSVFA